MTFLRMRCQAHEMAATHTINTVPVSFILWNEWARVEQVYKHTRDVTNTTQLQK